MVKNPCNPVSHGCRPTNANGHELNPDNEGNAQIDNALPKTWKVDRPFTPRSGPDIKIIALLLFMNNHLDGSRDLPRSLNSSGHKTCVSPPDRLLHHQ